jgi:hypothetical protein
MVRPFVLRAVSPKEARAALPQAALSLLTTRVPLEAEEQILVFGLENYGSLSHQEETDAPRST